MQIRPPIQPTFRQKVPWQWFDKWKAFEGSPRWFFHFPFLECHYDIAWHSEFQTFYKHSYRFRMQKALAVSNIRQVQKILEQWKEKGLKYDLDQVIDTKYNLSALHVAATTNSYAMIQYLLLNGANIDLKDPLGNTPLAYAAMNNCFEATHSLIERGAKIDVKDKYGYTIIEKAKNRQRSIVPYLQQQLKKPQKAYKPPNIKINPKVKKYWTSPWAEFVKNRKIFTGVALTNPFNNLKGIYRVVFSNYIPFQSLQYLNNVK